MFFISHKTLDKHIKSEVRDQVETYIFSKWKVEYIVASAIGQDVFDKAWRDVVGDPAFTEALIENINRYQLK